ncbi:MAG TPA: H-NS histone family protein [Zoogloea sp.]|jgi:DNA-binding protein H-NS|uniref:H-NS histone family protein n=1 Tax=Zoogloea sp. TaxID=49181 RepID=UPI001B5206D3|nr:H-NS histone family protein [Zoogloea sp.]MBP8265368.1 H-NS histone family protein [Zoogloea sp.]HOB47517.1 H-NS histone family protein [Zoogloea sp.]HQA12150.1 H-NS histone family protein [Zoogloea sp.]HQE39544.1 H-NS histone family protein [Zoogloea sp.]
MATLKELLAQQAELAKQIDEVRRTEVSKAIAQVQDIVQEYGLSLEEVFPNAKVAKSVRAVSGARTSKGEIRYRNPQNPSIGWSGKGRKPLWIVEGLAAGKSLQDFAV